MEDASPWCADVGRGTAGVEVSVVARGLEVPWDMEQAPDGRIFVTERPGRIRVVQEGSVEPRPWADLETYDESEAGLMGLALAPDFQDSGHLYVAVTVLRFPVSGWARIPGVLVRRVERLFGAPGTAAQLRVVRFTERDGQGTDPVVILDGIPAFELHAGAALAFGPDGALYLSMGDGGIPGAAADPGDPRGTILRIHADGTVPTDNPMAGSPVYAWGFRDVQGLAWSPFDGGLWATDHGPTGLDTEAFRTGRDELNRVEPGGDHGWPRVSGRAALEGTVLPVVEWTPAIAPAGLAVVARTDSPWFGDLLVTGLRGRQLRRVVPDPTAGGVVCQEVLLDGEYGRLRGIHPLADGSLLVSTSNRDRRGVPAPEDDRILRVFPLAGDAAGEGGESP